MCSGQHSHLTVRGSWFKSQLCSSCVQVSHGSCVDPLWFPPTVQKQDSLVGWSFCDPKRDEAGLEDGWKLKKGI